MSDLPSEHDLLEPPAEAIIPVLPTPKFKVGETIYWPAVRSEEVKYTCPDCAGTQKWSVTTATATFEVNCQRCAEGGYKREFLTTYKKVAEARSLVVSAIEAALIANPDKYQSMYKVQYRETGHGWQVNEKDCCATEAEALALAEIMAERENKIHMEKFETKREHTICKMDLRHALAEEAAKKQRDAEIKYDKAIDAIKELKENHYGIDVRAKDFEYGGDTGYEKIARYLLSELDESHPESWGEY